MDSIGERLKTSRVYPLGVDVTPKVPLGDGHPAPLVSPLLRHGDSLEGFLPTTVANEITICTQHTGTHIDALNHIGCMVDGEIYIHGYHRSRDIESHRGFLMNDISSQPPIVGRAVLIDVAKFKDVSVLPDSYSITDTDLRDALCQQNSVVHPGDTVVIRTGFMCYWENDAYRYTQKSAGLSLRAAKFLVEDLNVRAIGTDTVAVEVIPTLCLEVHQYCLFEKGLPLIENLYLEHIHVEQVYEFGIVISPLRLVGATASMVNPVAIL